MSSLKEYYLKLKLFLENLFVPNAPIRKEDLEEGSDDEMRDYDVKDGLTNLKRYPYNLSVDKNVEVEGQSYTVYKAYFDNLFDLYNYLTSKPEINEKVFRSLSSETGDSDFAGKSYDEALEDLVLPLDGEYDEFLSIQGDISSAAEIIVHRYESHYDCSGGGDIDYARLSSQQPDFYISRKRAFEPKYITLYLSLSYYWGTTKKQVWNRAAAITNIVTALEKAGYVVSVEAFELSKEDDEVCSIFVNLKNPDATLDMVGLYKALCHVEFLRRILFRVLETMPVTKGWNSGYGSTCDESFIREYLRLNQNDIFFDQPREMGVKGKCFINDLEGIVRHLKLEKHIDLEKAEVNYEVQKKLTKSYPN